MILQLDPRHPLVWRTPTSLQLGVDDPRVCLDDVTEAQERMISALVVGISRPGLDLIARSSGADHQAVADLLVSVRGALRSSTPGPAPMSVVISGVGETVERMSSLLETVGVSPMAAGADPERTADGGGIAVIVAHFVVDPALHGVWLRRDVPHLPVVLGDTGARIGPFVEPGAGPCLYCLERHRTDADPAWPAMAAQLWGRRSPLDSGLVAAEVAARATRMVLGRLTSGGGPASGPAMSAFLDAVTGGVGFRSWRAHPECGCVALPGTATAGAGPDASAPTRRTRGGAAGGRG